MCEQPCGNGGTCLKPNKCACPLGWTGPQCLTGTHKPNPLLRSPLERRRAPSHLWLHLYFLSDVDECRGRPACAQQCVNTAGSYRCACRDGFGLAEDGRSCQNRPSSPLSSSSPAAVGGHTDAGKRRLCVSGVCFQDSGQKHGQPRAPLLLLVRAMPLSTRTVSNNALRLVPTPDGWLHVVRRGPFGF